VIFLPKKDKLLEDFPFAISVINASLLEVLFMPCLICQSYVFVSYVQVKLSQGDVPLQGDFSAEHMIFGGIPYMLLILSNYWFSIG
jgi:hypothetical protein